MSELGDSIVGIPNLKSEEWRKFSFRGIPDYWFPSVQSKINDLGNFKTILNHDYFVMNSIVNSNPIHFDQLISDFNHESIFAKEFSTEFVYIQPKKNSLLNLNLIFHSHPEKEISGSNISILIDVPDDSQVNLKLYLDYHPTHVSFLNLFSYLGKNSKFNSISVMSGGARGKSRNHCFLAGEGAEFNAEGLSLLGGRESHFWDYKASHKNNHQTSQILHKTSVSSRSHHIFMGNLDILPNLKGIQSSQMSRNLLLDPTARAESIPNLEVKASNVNCVHGATVGELDEEQIYFLRSRGLNEVESRRLLWEGFLNSILDQVFPEDEKNRLMPNWSQKLWRIS
jgi:hypothetical protein